MKNYLLLEKYKQVIEINFKANFKEELDYLQDRYVADGLSDEEALKKAKEEIKRKYNVELDEYYPNIGDADIPEGPL
jgi:hypothetical protein